MKSESEPSTIRKSRRKCRYFNSAGGCQFGEQCRFKHQVGKKQEVDTRQETLASHDVDKLTINQALPTVVTEHNADVTTHDNSDTGSTVRDTGSDATEVQLSDNVAPKEKSKLPNKSRRHCRYFVKGRCRDGVQCKFAHPKNLRKPSKTTNNESKVDEQGSVPSEKLRAHEVPRATVDKPATLSECLSDLSEEGVKYLQNVEIGQLKKRFGKNDLEILEDDSRVFYKVIVRPTDPDWPYDVKEIPLCVQFPDDYPKKIFNAEIADNDQFPEHFAQYVNRAIDKHLKEHEVAQQLRNSVDLLFRPFLRWLDRNLESLFTSALKQIKFDAEARSAGLQFIPFDIQIDQSGGMTQSAQAEAKDTIESQPDSIVSNVTTVSPYDSSVCSVTTTVSPVTATVSPVTTTVSPVTTTVSPVTTTVSPVTTTVSPVTTTVSPVTTTISPTDTAEPATAMFDMIQTSKRSSDVKKGTEVRFRGLELHENTATVRLTSLTFTIICSRCKNREELPNVKEKTQVVLTCSKCSNAQSIVLTSSEMVHQHSSTVAFINPQGCLPLDLILMDCQLMLGCLNCSKETAVKGIHYGSTKNIWCHHCHQKLDMKVDSTRFHQLQQGNATDADILTVKLKKTLQVKDPAIKSGKPLPNNGACKHYKKSYRWMRFPCCGKCYPCDECHNESEIDHEMDRATRMICGFCAKEQPFTQKECVSCQSFMTAVHTSHWEGGKGCRDRAKMSRGDNKKYSNTDKTVSRHATKVDTKKKQK